MIKKLAQKAEEVGERIGSNLLLAKGSRSFALCILLVLLMGNQQTEQLRFNAIQIPSLVQRNANFWLVCQFELDQTDQLYSVKWYKNNEEFYRLLLPTSEGANLAGADLWISSGQQQQQQYFSQVGVNVMMSSSNATHVRLLNASLESEGVFACEISTQNLSTIRYEKEIRVYVLPSDKLQIIGFKSRYSLGDQVELLCSSDFSRPRPALGWFVNGRRIDASNKWFELAHGSGLQTTTNTTSTATNLAGRKFNEPSSLFRLTLGLKFKLTRELLEASRWSGGQFGNSVGQSWALAANQRNQSHWKQQTSAASSSLLESKLAKQSSVSPHQLPLLQEFKLELKCKYRLAEVSDVTFVEFLTRQRRSKDELEDPQASAVDEEQQRPPSSASSRRLQAERKWSAGGRPRLEQRWMTRPEVRLAKSPADSQVSQSKCPANRRQLLESILMAHLDEPHPSRISHQAQVGCKLGSLSLQPDDPVILTSDSAALPANKQPDESQSLEEGQAQLGRTPRQLPATSQTINENLLGDLISVNCSTISALLWDSAKEETNGARYYCADAAARKRSAISGKYHTNEDLGHTGAAPATNQRGQFLNLAQGHKADRGQPLVAYLSIGEPQALLLQQTQKWPGYLQAQASGSHLDQLAINANSADSPANPNEKDESENQNGSGNWNGNERTTTIPSPPGSEHYLAAPPLLEWFINNQEAPRAIAHYNPELPRELVAARAGKESPEDSLQEVPPSAIDYTEYFANFHPRPIQQHLMLNLRLDEKHFATPDSLLRLRCSSTQAQVLVAETATALILPVAALNNQQNAISRSTSNQPGQSAQGQGWQQRRLLPHNNRKHLQTSGAGSSRLRSNALSEPSNSGGSPLDANRLAALSRFIYLTTFCCLLSHQLSIKSIII